MGIFVGQWNEIILGLTQTFLGVVRLAVGNVVYLRNKQTQEGFFLLLPGLH